MAMHEVVDRRQHGEADLLHPGLRRAQQHQESRQQDNGQREGDDHAEASDGSQLGHAEVAGRKEGEEAHADGRSRQGQRLADGRAGRHERCLEARPDEPLGEGAHAELDAEVDARARRTAG